MKILGVVLLVAAGSVNAAAIPHTMGSDTRIKTVIYNPSNVYLMNFTVGNVSRIIFDKKEVVTDAYSGFNDGFEFTPKGNTLVIKPMTVQGVKPNAKQWNTNLLVSTDKGNYDFDLRITNLSDPEATYTLYITNPDDDRQFRLAMHEAETEKQAKKVEKARKKSLVRYNTDYKYAVRPRTNSESIMPEMVYDDGTFTYLEFKGSDIPAVIALDANDEKYFPETHAKQGDLGTIVLRDMPASILITAGKMAIKVTRGN